MATEKKTLNFPFEIKQEDIEETGVFKGYGSVFGNKDSHSDIVMPGAFTKSLLKGGRNGTGVAMLLQHDTRKPIGIWTLLAEDKKGLRVEGQLAMKTKDGQETFELMKMGALKGLSIGFDTIIDEIDKDKNVRFIKEVELWEISPVTFGSNKKATITMVKEFIKQAKTERELEKALRESDIFSKTDAQHVISLIKAVLRDSKLVEAEEDENKRNNELLSVILDGLKAANLKAEPEQVSENEMDNILESLKEIN